MTTHNIEPILEHKYKIENSARLNKAKEPEKVPALKIGDEVSELSWFKYDYPNLPYESIESAFRLLATNPKAHHDYELIMSYKSLREGLK